MMYSSTQDYIGGLGFFCFLFLLCVFFFLYVCHVSCVYTVFQIMQSTVCTFYSLKSEEIYLEMIFFFFLSFMTCEYYLLKKHT